MNRKITLSILIALILVALLTILALVINLTSRVTLKVVDLSNNNVSYYEYNHGAIFDDSVVEEHLGYTVKGLYSDASQSSVCDPSGKPLVENTTIYVAYNPITYNITYHNVDGLVNHNESTYTIESDTIVLLSVEKPGYEFVGWFNEESLNTIRYSIDAPSTGDIDLYAKFSLTNTINFRVNIYHQTDYTHYEIYSSYTSLVDVTNLVIFEGLYYEHYHYGHMSLNDNSLDVYYDLDTYSVTIKEAYNNSVVLVIDDVLYGSAVELPSIAHVEGYHNEHYADNGENIISDTIIYIIREANTDTLVTVNHYLIDSEGNITLYQTNYILATTDSVVYAYAITMSGYVEFLNEYCTTVKHDGSSVINIYYHEV